MSTSNKKNSSSQHNRSRSSAAPSNQQKKSPAHKKRKLRPAAAVMLVLIPVILIAAVYAAVQMQHPLKLKGDHYQSQIHREFDPKSNISSVFFDSADHVAFEGTVDTETPGEYQVSYSYKGKSYPFTVEVGDFEAPVFEVQDVSTDLLEPVTAETFITSISDDSVYSTMVEGAQTQEGVYDVIVRATDQSGNTAEKKAKLTRINDTEAPVIDGFEESVTMLQGRTYHPKNYTASDNLDKAPVISIDTSALNTEVPGTYPVNYTAIDRTGNQQVFVQNVVVQEDPDFGQKIVYMTFDDGPSANTLRILDILKANDVKATFFVTGTNPDFNYVMKDIVDSGNSIALHTYSHDYGALYASDEAYFQDLQAISDLVEQQTGVKSNVIRFPGGSSNMVSSETSAGIMSRLVDEVHNRGYEYFDWNVDSTDASGNGVPVATLVANATAGIGVEKAVILFHDTAAKDTTVEALPQIIKAYKDAGYQFRGLTADSMPVHHGVNN